MNSKRIEWLDVSRGIAFLMVIYSHIGVCNMEVMKYFSPIYLTIFFFVSGYLFKENCRFSVILEQRSRTLLLPFLILGCISILLSQILTFNAKKSILDALKGLLYQNGVNQILWFIAALYIYSLIFYWIDKVCKNTKSLLFISVLLFMGNVFYKYWLKGEEIPWHISTFGFACFYMALGKLYKRYESQIDKIMTKFRLVILMIVYIAVIFYFDLYVNFRGSMYIVDSLFLTLSGLLIIIYLSKYWINKKFFSFVGANTLFYFAFHGKVYSLLEFIASKLPIEHTEVTDLLLGMTIVFLDAIILIPFAKFVNKYCPQILGKGFKLW